MEQVIVGGIYMLLNVTLTRYNRLHGGDASWVGVEAFVQQPVSTGGNIKNLFVELDGVPGSGTYVFTLRLNGNPTTLTCEVAADGTSASDVVNEVAVVAGDLVSIECNPSDAPAPDNARYARWTTVFEGTTANESLLLGVVNDLISKTATEYNQVTGGDTWSATENDFRQVCPTGGVIKNLYISLSVDPGTAPDAYRFTLRVNGANSDDGEGNPLQVTITADNTTGNDTTHDIAVSAGDVLTLMCEPLNTPSAEANAKWGMTFVATTDGESIIMGGTDNVLHRDDTEYNYLAAAMGALWTGTEAERYQLAQECTLKKLYVLLSAAPGGTASRTFNLRVAGGAGNLSAVVSAGATTGNDTVNTDAIVDGNEVGIETVPSVENPANADAYWGLVCFIEAAAEEEEPKHTFSLDPQPHKRMSFHPNLKLG